MIVKSAEELAKATRERILVNDDKRQKIFAGIKKAYTEAHTSGNITPALKNATVTNKRRRGYSNPTAPLYATGQMAEGIFMGENDGTSIQIVARSHVLPSWHWSHRAKGIPKRRALNLEDITRIVGEALENPE